MTRRLPFWLWGSGLVLGTAVLPACGSVTAVPPALADSMVTDHVVSGVRVIHRRTVGSEVVSVRLYLLGGSSQLTRETAGIEALLVHAAALGGERSLARTGARAILDLEPDWTVLGFMGLRQDFDSAWSIFAERVTNPTLSAATIDQARNQLISAAQRRYSQPDLRIAQLVGALAFDSHPYSLDPWGTEASLKRITAADVRAYAAEQLVTSRMLLVVVGDLPDREVSSRVAATIGALPAGTYRSEVPPPVPQHRYRWHVENRPLPTNYILCYFAGPRPTDGDDYYAFRVATALLSNRIEFAVREQQSLSYAAYAPYRDGAVPVGGFYASTPNPGRVIRLMRRALVALPWTPDSVPYWVWDRFLDGFTLQEYQRRLTSDAQAETLGRAQILFGDYRAADEYVAHIRGVSKGDVARVAKEHMLDFECGYLGDTTLMRGEW
jgi:zinc protease